MPQARVAPTYDDEDTAAEEQDAEPTAAEAGVVDTPVQSWTNLEVLRWLLRVDQKQFLAPFVTNNVTGAVLLDALDASPSLTLAALAGDPSEMQLAGLRALVAQLQPKPTPTEDVGKKGWTFDNELVEWNYFVDAVMHRERARRILKQLKQKKEYVAVMTLLISVMTTVVSIVGSSVAGTEASDSDGADGANSTDAGGDADDISKAAALSYVTTALSALATLLAGFSRIFDFDSKVKAWQDGIDGFCDDYSGLLEQLLLPPHERDEHVAWAKRKKERFDAQPDLPEVDPDAWDGTLRQIARKQPETWRSVFGLAYHLSWPGSKKLDDLRPDQSTMGEPSAVPRWAWWFGMVEFEPIWTHTVRATKAVNTFTGRCLCKFWPDEYAETLKALKLGGDATKHSGRINLDA